MKKNELYLVGKIVATHGIKGELKVKSDTSFNRFDHSILYIKNNNDYETITVNSHRVHQNFDLITINDLHNINDVLKYIGCDIYTKHQLEELASGEYYYEDLIGKMVYSTNNEKIGEVIDIREVPQGIILEVQTPTKVALIPFVKAFVKEIADDIIFIEVIEGLI